jgi:hypothetical protein
MKHTMLFDHVIAQTACAGILLAVFGALACSSSDHAISGQTGGSGAAEGGASAGGHYDSGGSGGTTGNGSGGTISSNGGGPSGGGSVSKGGSGGSTSGSGSGGSSGFGGTSNRTTLITGGSGGSTSSTGGTTGNGSGGTVSSSGGGPSGGGSVSKGGSSSISTAGSAGRGSGGSSSFGGRSGGAAGSSGGSGGSSTAGSTGSGFDPCPATGNCKILPLGDSITAGAGQDPGDGGGYRSELFTKAVNDSKHITFVGSLTSGPSTIAGVAFPKNHEGHIGYKIDQITSLATTSQALKDSPQIVLLFIGTNDEGYASSQAGASDRLGTLIDKIVAALPNSLLVVSSIYPFPGCKDTNYTPTQCAANVATYNSAIPGVVKQRADKGQHVLFVDMSNMPSDGLSGDNVHPNHTVGYPWMGDNWYAVVRSYLH